MSIVYISIYPSIYAVPIMIPKIFLTVRTWFFIYNFSVSTLVRLKILLPSRIILIPCFIFQHSSICSCRFHFENIHVHFLTFMLYSYIGVVFPVRRVRWCIHSIYTSFHICVWNLSTVISARVKFCSGIFRQEIRFFFFVSVIKKFLSCPLRSRKD